MMHLALLQGTSRRRRSDYRAYPDLLRQAELRRAHIPSPSGRGIFHYSGSRSHISGESFAESIAEVALEIAARYPLEESAMQLVAMYLGVRLSAPEPLVEPEVAPAQSAAAEQPIWISQINSMRTHEVGQIANSIRSVLRQHAQPGGARSIEEDFTRIDFSTANDFHLVAVLRALRPHRKELDNWQTVLRNAHEMLLSKKLNADQILKGLDA